MYHIYPIWNNKTEGFSFGSLDILQPKLVKKTGPHWARGGLEANGWDAAEVTHGILAGFWWWFSMGSQMGFQIGFTRPGKGLHNYGKIHHVLAG